VCEDELDLEAQWEVLASWKAAQELVQNKLEDKPDIEAQRAAITS